VPKNGVLRVSAYFLSRLIRFLEALAADQQHDRQVEAASPHQVDQRRRPALQALAAPIDHHATDRGVGLDGDLGVFELARLDHLEARPLDLPDDLVEPYALEVVGVEVRHREQKGEPPKIIHCLPPTYGRTCRRIM
jgi:hypothetical protein